MQEDDWLLNLNRKYIFPVQFVVGCIGNILNLIVLNSRGMRTKTNCFLSAMAVADLGFFLAMFPINIFTSFNLSSYSLNHQRFFFYAHIPSIAFANWFSAASIWLTIGVTVERMIAIKFPLLARIYWKKRHIILFIISVYMLSLIFSLYHFAWRTVKFEESNYSNHGSIDIFNSSITKIDNRSRYTWALPDNGTLRYWYVHISHGWATITVVAFPLASVTVLSGCLIYYLRLNTNAVQGLRAGSALLRRGERRVTITITILIAAFTLFNLPSGVFSVIEISLNRMNSDKKRQLRWFFDLAEVANALTCTYKAINFVLYCSASSGFRRKLISLITRHRFCGTVMRTLSTRFSISSGNGECGVSTNCKYTFMTTVFQEARCCNGDSRYHHHHEQRALCGSGHLAHQRRTHPNEANSRSRTSSNAFQLQALRPPTPAARERTASML